MASDLVVRLVGEDKGFDKILKNAKDSLQDFSKQADTLDRARQRFNQISQGSGTLQQNLAATKKEMQRLAAAGLQGTDTFQSLAKAAADYKKELQGVEKAINDAIGGQEKLNGKGSLKSLFSDPKAAIGDIASEAGLGGISKVLGAVASPAGAAVAGIGAVGAVMVEAGKKAAEFETSITSLGALTGLQGDDLNALGQSARDLAKTYGSSATEVLASMETIGSQAPELLKNKDALVAVTDAANVLAKSGGMSVDEAAKAITTTMNQMGVSASEAMNIVNTLGAGSQQGAAGIDYLNKAFEKAGTQAKAAGMGYVELAAAIETVAPKFSSADVAGTAFNGTLLKLSQAEDKFNPQVVGLSKALANLAEANLGNAEMSKLVGESNITMLSTLIEGREQFDEYTKSLKGTTTAQEQAAQKMQTFEEKMNRLKTSWDDFLISLGQTSFIQGTMGLIAELGEGLMEVVECLGDVFDALCSMGDNQVISPLDQIKFAFKAIVEIVKGVCTAVEIVIRAIAKFQEKVKQVVEDYVIKKWDDLKKTIGDTSWYKAVKNALDKIKKFFKDCIDWVVEKWNKMCAALGMEGKMIKVQTEIQQIQDDIDTAVTTNGGTSSSKGGGSSSKTKGGKASNSPSKEIAPEGSLEALEKELSEYNNKLKRLGNDASQATIDEINNAIKELQERIKQQKIKIGTLFETDKTKLDDLKKELATAIERGNDQGVKEALRKADELGVTFGATLRQQLIEGHKKSINDVQKLYEQNLITEATAKEIIKPLNDELEKLGQKPIELAIKPKIVAPQVETLSEIISSIQAMSGEVGQITDKFVSLGNSFKIFDDLKKYISDISDEEFEDLSKQFGNLSKETMMTMMQIGQVGGAMSVMGETVSSLGQSLEQLGASSAVAKIGMIAGAIGQLVLGYATATAQAATMGPWAWIGFAAAGLATLTATIASISQFESGGIVGGNSYKGDKILARLNSGEMVINKSQQASLYAQINGGASNGNGMNGNVTFTIHGSTLKGCLNNFDKKMSKIK